jgi:chemotaxis protein methyltransferase CheR
MARPAARPAAGHGVSAMEEDSKRLEAAIRRVRATAPRPVLDNATFLRLRALIATESGMEFDDESRFIVERRLLARLRALRLESFEAYHRYLRYSPRGDGEISRMLEAVAINETYFFRERRQLEAFRYEVLPILASENAATRTLRIWSAGCASGEEAYSIAILVDESHLFEGWRVEIRATDLVEKSIAAARGALYRETSLRATPEEARARYFTRVDEQTWRLDERIRRMVEFDVANLLDADGAAGWPGLDAIFCRNVLSYFGAAARRRAVRLFHERLREGGFLLLGYAESLAALDTPFRLCALERDVVYRK